MKKVDAKSAIIGFLLGVCLLLGLGAAVKDGEARRYEISSGDSTAFVLDTQTGQVWRIINANNWINYGKPKN